MSSHNNVNGATGSRRAIALMRHIAPGPCHATNKPHSSREVTPATTNGRAGASMKSGLSGAPLSLNMCGVVRADANAPQSISRSNFLSSFDRLVDILMGQLPSDLPSSATQYIEQCLRYNVPHGKLNRGMSVLETLQAVSSTPLSPDEQWQAHVLGWCVEWLQAFFLVADDVMDKSVTRRQQLCWYRLPHVGEGRAVNDAFLLEVCIYKLLESCFSQPHQRDLRLQLVDLFHHTSYQTELGQLLDMYAMQFPQDFTVETHKRIVKYKTCYYSFYLPMALGMTLAGIRDPKAFQQTESICLEMGEFFQIQDDYLDCYGDARVMGKEGTDIQDKKCSWLIVTALGKASAKQQEVLIANYGIDDPAAIARVKRVFNELRLKDDYSVYEENSYRKLRDMIGQVHAMPTAMFESMLKKIYKRDK